MRLAARRPPRGIVDPDRRRHSWMGEEVGYASAALAHDLRTPLTRIRTILDAALREDDRVSQRDCIERAMAGCDDMAELLGSLLRITELKRGGIPLPKADVDLVELCTFLHEAFEPAIVDGGRTISLCCEGPAVTRANRALLAQAVSNLLDNAQLHTPIGTNIVLSIVAKEAVLRIGVSDDGPGVPDTVLNRLTERFYRATPGRSPPGHGLGLSLAAAIAAAHGADLRVFNDGPGLRVVLSFASMPDDRKGAEPPARRSALVHQL